MIRNSLKFVKSDLRIFSFSFCSGKIIRRIAAAERIAFAAFTMSAQRKISSFFASPDSSKKGTAGRRTTTTTSTGEDSPGGKSRRPRDPAGPEGDGGDDGQSVKRSRLDVNENGETAAAVLPVESTKKPSEEEKGIGSSRGLGEEERSRMEENRLQAKLKLMTTQTRGLVVKVHPSWFTVLEPEFSKPYFSDLAAFVEEERKKYTVYPSADEVFAWTCMTPVKETKVVILGQDPYHGVNQAHGLCFSVKKGIALPPSLENMFKELTTDIDGFVAPKHGCLNGWAEQGVLLLNAVLTVRAHNANSHKDRGWEKLTDAVVAHLNKNSLGIVFILWGSYAQKKGSQIDKKKHHVIQGPHPSPLSAHRGFFGCRHFSRCNELLEKEGKSPIIWSNLP